MSKNSNYSPIGDAGLNPEKDLARLESVLDSARLGIWDWYPKTNEVVFNKQWKKMLGYEMDELPDILDSWTTNIHPDDLAETYVILNKHLKGETSFYESEHRMRHKDGHYIWILDTGKVVKRDDEGKPVRVTGIHKNITTRKKLEQQLLLEKEEAVKANNAKSRFLATMSHEIRTPMNGILGAAKLLEDMKINEEQAELIGIINQSTGFLLGIINDILDFSKIEANCLVLEKREFNVKVLGDRIKSMFEVNATNKGLLFTVNSSEGIIIGDENRLLQILLNLVSNAIKFTQKGYVYVEILLKKEEETLCLKVRDSGKGIKAEFIEKIFNPFTQEDSSTTRMYGGTGLGTSIVKRLADLMEGKIKVDSKLNVGTTFEVNIPVKITSNYLNNKNTNSKNISGFNRNYGKTVILAEDNTINIRVAELILKKLGVQVIVATNGKEVINLINNGREHELILMDCHMPIMDGTTTTEKLRASGYSKPIIAVTGSVFSEEIKHYLTIGMNDVIGKPFLVERLVKVFDKYF